ncbi:MAG TPA: tetratricopeptide repeat protein [Anaerolineales bacterium]|nr:tetratricopeptide repeat protein [Anaerolineales bacterium]
MDVYELWNELGNKYFVTGSYSEAASAYKKAIDLMPDVGETYSNLALTYMQLGMYPEASENYQQSTMLLKDEFDKAISLNKLGEAYSMQEMYNEAADAYHRANELLPDLDDVLNSSEPTDLLLGCQVPATYSEKAIRSVETLSVSSSSASDVKNQQYLEELTPWQFDDQIEPPDAPEHISDFLFVEELGAYGLNDDVVFTESLEWESEPTERKFSTGSAPDVAYEVRLKKPLQLAEVGTVTGMETVASGTMSVGRERSIADVETITVEQNDPASRRINPEGLEILTVSPEFTTESLTDVDAVQYESVSEWADVEISQGERLDIQADINKIERVLDVNPTNAFAWDTLGEHYKALGQYEKAIDAFHKSIGLDSSNAEYFYHLGLVYAVVDKHDEAINAFEQVIVIDSRHGLAHAILGGYYRKNGNEELAQEHIEVARELVTDNENEYNRACMESICGNADQSLELLELALKNKNSYVNLARKDPDLDFIRSDPRFHALLEKYVRRSS